MTLFTRPKPVEELHGLVYGMANKEDREAAEERAWYRRPATLAAGALGLTAILSVIFARPPRSGPTRPA